MIKNPSFDTGEKAERKWGKMKAQSKRKKKVKVKRKEPCCRVWHNFSLDNNYVFNYCPECGRSL